MTRYWVDHGRLLFEERTSSLCYAVVAYGLVGALACLWFAAKLVWLPTIDDITGLPEPLSIADQALVAGLLAFAALHSMTLWLCCGTWVEVWEDGAVMMGFMFAAGERIWRGRIEDIEAFGHCHTADEYDPKDGGAPYVDVRHQGRLWLGAWTKESFECFAAALGRPVPEPIFEAHVRTQTWRNMRRIEQGSGKQRRTRATKAKSLSGIEKQRKKENAVNEQLLDVLMRVGAANSYSVEEESDSEPPLEVNKWLRCSRRQWVAGPSNPARS